MRIFCIRKRNAGNDILYISGLKISCHSCSSTGGDAVLGNCCSDLGELCDDGSGYLYRDNSDDSLDCDASCLLFRLEAGRLVACWSIGSCIVKELRLLRTLITTVGQELSTRRRAGLLVRSATRDMIGLPVS